MKNRWVLIIYPWSNLDTVPSLCAAIELLVAHGYHVDIFMPQPGDFEFPKFDTPGVQIIFPEERPLSIPKERPTSSIQKLVRSKAFYPLRKLLRPSKRVVVTRLEMEVPLNVFLQRHRQTPYKCIIGVDPQGVVRAGELAEFLGIPLVYWSLELLLSQEVPDNNWQRLKKMELTYSRKAQLIVIQDEERAKLMASDNGLPIDKFLFVPNAPLGPAQQDFSRFWHRQLSLSENQKIVLHAGSLGDWTGITDIVSSVKGWPNEWALVVHTRYHNSQQAIIESFKAVAEHNRVFFSTHPVLRTNFSELVAGADIGIGFYLPVYNSPHTQENIHTIGLSSGKIAYYLKAGLPVIVNRWPSISQIIKQEGCGVVVDDADEIGDALVLIAQRYEEYSHNACKVFEKYLDPSKRIEQLINRIDGLGEGEHGAH